MSIIREEEATSNRIYDWYAESYGYDVDATVVSRLKYELVRKYLQPNARVLDVGCANGIHMRLIAGLCERIVGVDINDKMLALATAKLEEAGIRNAQVLTQSATDLDFDEETFGMVYCFSTLSLIPDTCAAIWNMVHVLKSGGIAILDIAGRYNLSQWHWRKYFRSQGHFCFRAFSYPGICRVFREVGLEVIEVHASGVTSQWKYIPVLRKARILDNLFHSNNECDLDYRVSNVRPLFWLAGRWYFVCRKRLGSGGSCE